jgi:molybdate transport system ATP-binding protein
MFTFDLSLRRDGFELCAEGTCEGGVTGVFGHSGAGKSTLLHLLSGLLRPTRGTFVLDGETFVDTTKGIDRPCHERGVAVVFQDHRLFPHLSARGNLDYGRKHGGPARTGPTFDAVVDLLELRPLLARRPRDLSGGEAQRVTLARALLSSPRLLLCDEPLSSLDPGLKREILPFLRRAHEVFAIPMLYVSHQLGEILQLTSDLIVLERGRVAAAGRYRDLALLPNSPFDADEALNVLEATAERRDGMTLLTVVPSGDRQAPPLLASTAEPLPTGRHAAGGHPDRVSVTIHPDDVALARGRIAQISIQNQLPGRVVRVTDGPSRVFAEIDVGFPLLACVTHQAASAIEVAPGREVWCLIKASAVRIEGGA